MLKVVTTLGLLAIVVAFTSPSPRACDRWEVRVQLETGYKRYLGNTPARASAKADRYIAWLGETCDLLANGESDVCERARAAVKQDPACVRKKKRAPLLASNLTHLAERQVDELRALVLTALSEARSGSTFSHFATTSYVDTLAHAAREVERLVERVQGLQGKPAADVASALGEIAAEVSRVRGQVARSFSQLPSAARHGLYCRVPSEARADRCAAFRAAASQTAEIQKRLDALSVPESRSAPIAQPAAASPVGPAAATYESILDSIGGPDPIQQTLRRQQRALSERAYELQRQGGRATTDPRRAADSACPPVRCCRKGGAMNAEDVDRCPTCRACR